MENSLEKFKHIYFIGIGGIGMSAIARMFLLEGKDVSGSDLSASEVTDELIKLGAKINIGEPGNVLPENVDLVIYTVAIPNTHSEFIYAKNKNIKTISYPESLGLVSENKFTIAVAGTHGKTTTTAMIAQIFIDAGFDPTVIVGSFLKNYKSNFIAGKSKYFIVEACEYKRSFLNLSPNIAVITNIDEDHLDYYTDLVGVQSGFRDFIGKIKPGGEIITDTGHSKIKPVLESTSLRTTDYTLLHEDIRLKIPGEHNIKNAHAALAVALSVGISKGQALNSLSNFSGTWRRFDYLGETKTGALVYDDYAHHPSEIIATLKGARQKFPNQKIIVAFQPHLYSRTKEHFDEFGPALSLADEIILLPIYAAREQKDETVSSEILADKLIKSGLHVSYFNNFKLAEHYLEDHLKTGDVFFSMGAGDINRLGQAMIK